MQEFPKPKQCRNQDIANQDLLKQDLGNFELFKQTHVQSTQINYLQSVTLSESWCFRQISLQRSKQTVCLHESREVQYNIVLVWHHSLLLQRIYKIHLFSEHKCTQIKRDSLLLSPVVRKATELLSLQISYGVIVFLMILLSMPKSLLACHSSIQSFYLLIGSLIWHLLLTKLFESQISLLSENLMQNYNVENRKLEGDAMEDCAVLEVIEEAVIGAKKKY